MITDNGNGRMITPIIDSDPLKELFSQSDVTVLGDPEKDQMPQEVVDFFESHDLGVKHWYTSLWSLPVGSDGNTTSRSRGTHVKTWAKMIPSLEYITQEYGPGEYNLDISWFEEEELTNGKKSRKKRIEHVPVLISKKAMPIYRRHQYKKRLEEMKEMREDMRNAKIESSLEKDLMQEFGMTSPAVPEKKENVKEYVNEVLTVAEMMGLKQKQSGGIEEIAKLVLPLLPAIVQAMSTKAQADNERFDKMMMLMMQMSSSSNNQLVEMMKNFTGPTTASEQMKEFSTMIFNAIDLKEAISGKKESVVDKVFGLLEQVAPAVVQLASMPQQERQKQIPYQMAQTYAKTMPEIAAIKNSPDLTRDMIERLDEKYGERQANGVLECMGLSRPEDMRRDLSLYGGTYEFSETYSGVQSPGRDYRTENSRGKTADTAQQASRSIEPETGYPDTEYSEEQYPEDAEEGTGEENPYSKIV